MSAAPTHGRSLRTPLGGSPECALPTAAAVSASRWWATASEGRAAVATAWLLEASRGQVSRRPGATAFCLRGEIGGRAPGDAGSLGSTALRLLAPSHSWSRRHGAG